MPEPADPARPEGLAPPLSSYLPVHLLAIAVVALSFGLSIGRWPDHPEVPNRWDAYGNRWLDGYPRWDGGWYGHIATRGYFFSEVDQSPIPFFPLYPLLMRLGARLTGPAPAPGHYADLGHAFGWGIAINVVCGLLAVSLLARWTAGWMGTRAGRAAALCLSCYPLVYYLCGPVYSESTYLALALGAFCALDRGHLGLAALLGALATASRPVGPALVVGLTIAALERRGVVRRSAPYVVWSRARATDLVLLLSALGGLAYFCFLFQFATESIPGWAVYPRSCAAPGWRHQPGPASWLKLEAWHQLSLWPWGLHQVLILFHLGITVGAFALVPRVARRIGLGAAAYAAGTLIMPCLSNKDFVAMGRYALCAFPCFAVLGELLSRRPRLQRALGAGGLLLLSWFASRHCRWFYVS